MSTSTPSIVIMSSPTNSEPPSPQPASPRPPLGARSSSWSGFGDYTIAASPNIESDTFSDPGDADLIVATRPADFDTEPTATHAQMLHLSPTVSPRNSISVGRPAQPVKVPKQVVRTPVDALSRVFTAPASEGLSERLRELARQTDTTVLEVLRRLSEAERESALSKDASSKSELREFFKTFLDCNEYDLEACFRLNLPIATWEHVADEVKMDRIWTRKKMITALYWRAKQRGERLEMYRTTGRA